MTDTDPVRVLIVDDHELFAHCLKLALDREQAIDCVGIAHDGDAAVDLALARSADVVLMDLSLPTTDGFAAARRLLAVKKAAKVIALTGLEEADVHDRVVDAGMVAYLSKDRIGETVVPAILAAVGR
jgi:DNA-binding NarL/FixJ family response regulator